ncbi:transposase [Candidatus Gracilibacteria bacterium]|nr:transposase [Candidatus Gracilibacteria bacterium]
MKQCWEEIAEHFEGIELGKFIVMPNHIHGIIIIHPNNEFVGTRHALSLPGNKKYQKLPVIIGSFKSAVTRKLNKLYPQLNFQWQRSFYDHIIRGEKSLERIHDYIRYNATKWELDRENPLNFKKGNREKFLEGGNR